MKKLITLLSLFLSLGAFAQNTHTLIYKMEPGTSYRYLRENSVTATQEMAGNEMTVTADTRNLTEYLTGEVTSDGRIVLMAKTLEASAHTNMMGKDTTVQLTDEIGKSEKTEMTLHGKPVKGNSEDSTKAVATGFDIGAMNQSDFMKLPVNPVAMGEKWVVNEADTVKNDEIDIIVTTVTSSELTGTESRNGHDCLKVTFKTTYEINGKMKQYGMEMFIEGEGNSDGAYWFDEGRGLLAGYEGVINQDVTIAITGQSQMTIPSSQVINQKITLIE